MMRKWLAIFLTISALTGLPAPAAEAENPAVKRILDNGLTVLVEEMPSSPVVSVYGLVKTGAATEGKFLGSGISHFIEHMLFKGTHGRGVGELANRVQAVGGTINAATSMDYTIYTITVPDESFDTALDILSDMLMNATMDAEEVEKEREVIFGEMRLRYDDPDRRHSELVFQNAYINHPYRHPIIGYEQLFAKLTREDLVEYYHDKYTPNNTVISVAGHIRVDEVLPKIEKAFSGFERSRPSFRNLPVEPDQITSRFYEEEYPTELTRISISFGGVRLLHPDLYALDLLAGILGIGRSSRLYQDVFEAKGLVHHIEASNYTPIDQGLFGITCLLDPAKTDQAIAAILEDIESIKKKGVSKEELARIKTQVRSSHILQNQTSSTIARRLAIDEAFTGDHEFSLKYLKAIDNVMIDDIQRVANKYLVPSSMTTVILKPEAKKDEVDRAPSTLNVGEIQKHVLKNGLTVLLKEDNTVPVVSLRLTAAGGVRQEDEALNGLSQMVSATWIKGTKRRSARDIAEFTEGSGMRLESFSGRNSFGIELEILSEHLPEATELLADIAFNPTFEQREVNKVRTQMKAVIHERNDNIFHVTGMALKKSLFQTHPFRLDKAGTLESVDAIRQEDVKRFYEKFAVGPNMVLSVFGDIDAAKTLKEIQKAFGGLDSREVTLKTHHEEPPETTREQTITMDKKQAMVMIGFQGPKLQDPDYFGTEVMTNILGSPFEGRIFRNIRDNMGKAYTLGGQYIPTPDMGFIYFYILTTEEDVERVKETLLKEIEQLKIILAADTELKDVKTFLKGMYEAGQETVSSLSFTVSLDELYGVGYDRYQQYDAHIDAVTKDDIQRLAKQYLDLKKMAVVITLPEK